MSDATMADPGSSSGSSGSTPGKAGQRGSRPPLSDIKELGGQLVNAARNGANSLYEEQRNRAAGEISALGSSLQRSAKSLDGTIGEVIAPYAETAAKQVEDFAGTLRERSMNQIGSDIEGFARQWPMAFLAAAVGAGFFAGRFLFSSGSPIEVVTGHSSGHSASSAKPESGSEIASGAARTLAAPDDKPVAHGAMPGAGDK